MDIVYVDENDQVIGSGSVPNAVNNGIRVRIARVFLTNSDNEILIQKRSAKSHSLPNRWDQTAAGHVDKGEDYAEAALRELNEEMGISGVPLKQFAKYYTEEKDEVKLKRRFNVVFVGSYDGEVKIDHDEVSAYKWIKPEDLNKQVTDNPDDFTEGFINAFRVLTTNKLNKED